MTRLWRSLGLVGLGIIIGLYLFDTYDGVCWKTDFVKSSDGTGLVPVGIPVACPEELR